jgi:hypothetical protein
LAKDPAGTIRIGGIYVHLSPESGADTAHRVVAHGSSPGTWVTQGDNNPARDNYELTDADFGREVIGRIPAGGYVNNALANPFVRVLMLAVPLLLLPTFLPGVRRARSGTDVPFAAPPAVEAAQLPGSRPAEYVAVHLSRLDRTVSVLVAVAAFGVIGAIAFLHILPVVIPALAAPAPVTSGAMGLLRPHEARTLHPGDVIYVTMPRDFVPTVRVIVPNDPYAAVAPTLAGMVRLTSIDLADASGRDKIAQLPATAAVPTVVGQVPRLGAWLPVFATRSGQVGLLVVLGLMATALLMRVAMSSSRTNQETRPIGTVAAPEREPVPQIASATSATSVLSQS